MISGPVSEDLAPANPASLLKKSRRFACDKNANSAVEQAVVIASKKSAESAQVNSIMSHSCGSSLRRNLADA